MYQQFTPYQPYQSYQPIMPTQQMQQQTQQQVQQVQQIQPVPMQQTSGDGVFFFVSGMEEVNRWVVPPGKNVFLFDRNQNTFYIKAVDVNGMPKPIEICDYKRREAQPQQQEVSQNTPQMGEFATKEELKNFKEEILALIPKRPQTGKKTKQEVEENDE